MTQIKEKTYPMWDCRIKRNGVQSFYVVSKTKKGAERRVSLELAVRKDEYLKCRKLKTMQGLPLGAMGGEIKKVVRIRKG